MRLVTISNLYPRPDQPTRGLFNFQLFREMGEVVRIQASGSRIQNICLVPEWRVWRWPAIRRWSQPGGESTAPLHHVSHLTPPVLPPTVYLPVFYLPFLGRSLNWWFYYHALRKRVNGYELSVICNNNNKQPITDNPAESGVILASWLYPDAVAAARLARERGVPVWLRVHGTDRFHLKNRLRRRLILEAVADARGVICNCRAVADDLVKYGIPSGKIHIIPNGIDTSLFRYRDKKELLSSQVAELLREEKGAGTGINNLTTEPLNHSRIILFIGNLVPIKAPDVMLRAFAALGEREGQEIEGHGTAGQVAAGVPAADGQDKHEFVRRDAERHLVPVVSPLPLPSLLIIGSGPMRGQLERLAEDLGIAGRVHFLGNRPHAEVALWMNRADVLCLTSHSEGMPNVVLEALVSGLPVVATAVGACPELLAEEPAARLCPAGDVPALAGAVQELLEMAPDHQALAARYLKHHSWQRQAESLLQLLEKS